MGIQFFVFRTRLQNEAKHVGRILLKDCYDREMLVQRMLAKGTSMTKTDILAVMTLFTAAVEEVCQEGNKINLDGFLQVTPVMGGLFDDLTDGYQPGRNSIYLTAQVSRKLNQRITRNAVVEVASPEEKRPQIRKVVDNVSTTGALGMGRIISLIGKRLKLDLTKAGEYLRLVNADDPGDFVEVVQFHKCNDNELIFLLPEVSFNQGYFEISGSLNTTTLRKSVSEVYELEAQK